MDDNLINILPGLVSSVEDSIYLGNKFYPELLKNGYGNTKEWIQEKGQESGRWFFTADVDSGRVVIVVTNPRFAQGWRKRSARARNEGKRSARFRYVRLFTATPQQNIFHSCR